MERFLGESYESNPALWEFASATTHASQNSPPALLIASQADTTVPYEQSLLMARRAQKLNSICCRVLAISPFGFITCGYTTEPLNFSIGTCSRSSK